MWSLQKFSDARRRTLEKHPRLHPRSDSLSQTSQQIRGKCLNSGWCQWIWSWRLPVVCCSTKNLLNFIQMLFDVDVWKWSTAVTVPKVWQLSGRTESCHEYIIYQETERADDTHSKPLQTSHLHSSPEWPRRKAVNLQLRTPSAQTLFQGSQRKNATSAFCWEGWLLRWKQRCRSPAVCTLCPRGSGPRLWTLRSPVWFRSRCGWEASQHRQRSPLWLWARHRPKSHLNHLLDRHVKMRRGQNPLQLHLTNATRKKGCWQRRGREVSFKIVLNMNKIFY